jgi:two-component system response regulator HydG
MVKLVTRFAEKQGFTVIPHSSGRDTLAELHTLRPDVAMVDLRMPDVGGLDVLRAIRGHHAGCQVILMTGEATIDTAIEAIKLGAMDYLSKPLDLTRLGQLLTIVRDDLDKRRLVLASESEVARQLEFCGMIGRSQVMQELFGLIRRIAPHARMALVTGETGTGKELVARALHARGPRAARRFVTMNCSAVVESLFESELFGHVRGAFTGATETKQGVFELADMGTLFMDEIGELPLPAQAKLLRTLETGEVQRVGGPDARRVDVNVIAATNRDLVAEIAAGRFRSDLYYRLNIVEIHLSPLRDRREDIPYLVAAFVRGIAERLGKPMLGPTPAAERLLMDAPWTGNVRELRNAIERACILCEGNFFGERELSSALGTTTAPPHEASKPPSVPLEKPSSNGDGDLLLATAERDHIVKVLQRARGNKKLAAQQLGVSRRALYRRLDRLGLR